ncbi:3'-5' exonuclease [Hymenobacter busanensis]|uniref:3'-5' exonuclease n=1 Tax=Hymenobacter busanensis TaxID=2607656 RepID=A0A7L4ZTP8_9BACT|nr:3'-5' exonuclease [Hymenobacter busanensis]KAA9339474.1 3'-5' exonuclease [Hymenobacter busanensis]QHJ06769.1 3'-5' exonuclease [Hymenobacter busanensis]
MTPEYLLFIDTETTGLPSRWDLPYASDAAQWPYVAQVAWQVYSPEGTLIKQENHYLHVPDGAMRPAALAVHGLTPDFLRQFGQEPSIVLRQLHQDLLTYRPRVVGYFLQLDFHVLGAGFHRAGLPNLLPELPQFCVMRVTERPVDGSHRRFRRLAELYEQLFELAMPQLHDACEDAAATARCFFELQRRGKITHSVLTGQPPLQLPGLAGGGWSPWRPLLLAAAAGALVLLLLAFLWKIV